MNIGIDGNEANQTQRVGIGQVAYNALCQLEKQKSSHNFLIYLKNSPLKDFPAEREGWRYKVFGPGKLWTQFALPVKLFTQKDKLDIFFTPSHYAPRYSPVPTVIYLMDLWHHRHPEQFAKKDLYQLINWEKYSVKQAAHILTISEFTKSEIIDIYHLPASKVTVVYPAFDNFPIQDRQTEMISKIKNKYQIKNDYLLYLGTLQPKKNLVKLIEAFAAIAKKHNNLSLVLAGKKGWLYEDIFEKIRHLGLEKQIIFTGFFEEEEKPLLLAGASAFVFPSLYEGFGIPVLEALSLGVPVVCARAGSLPEVGGEAAIYFNPESVTDIAQGIEKILSLNKKERSAIIALGYKQIQKFSWEKFGQEIFRALENVKR